MNHVYFLYINILWNNGCLQTKNISYTSGVQILSNEPYCAYYKYGNVVTVTCEFGEKSIQSETFLPNTLPIGFRPSITVYARNCFESYATHMVISPYGSIQLICDEGHVISYGRFTCTYPVAFK